MNFYNEFDPGAAEWLRELIKAGLIPYGHVDERSITDIHPSDLAGYRQHHLFAGIGGWSAALRLARWPEDRPVFTFSCPCQPFSTAGKRKGFEDERHLWPAVLGIIRKLRPDTCFAEQVASPDGLAWLSAVHADLEAEGYAVAPFDLCAAGVGAPHIRQRLYIAAKRVGDPHLAGLEGRPGVPERSGERTAGETGVADGLAESESQQPHRLREEGGGRGQSANGGPSLWLANTMHAERREIGAGGEDGRHGEDGGREEAHGQPGARGEIRGVADADGAGREPRGTASKTQRHGHSPVSDGDADLPGPLNGFWRSADWLLCRDGKWRPAQPFSLPLADGILGRVGLLRGYGNAICVPLAAEFIAAFLEAENQVAFQ